MIVVNDADVVVISLHAFFDLGINELWIEYGSGKHQRWLPIHTYAQVLVEEVCYTLRFGMLLPVVTQFCHLQEGEKGQYGIWETCFPETTSCFVRFVCLKHLV